MKKILSITAALLLLNIVASPVRSMLGAKSIMQRQETAPMYDAELEWVSTDGHKAFLQFDWYITELSGFSVSWMKTSQNYYTSLVTCGLDTDYSKTPYTFRISISDGGRNRLAYAISSDSMIDSTLTSCPVTANVWHELEYVNNNGNGEFEIICDGSIKATGESFVRIAPVRDTQPLTFLARYKSAYSLIDSDTGYWTGSNYRVRHIAIWRKGILWHDLIPVRFTNAQEESEVGFYDRIQNKVHKTARDPFVAGPDKAIEEEI